MIQAAAIVLIVLLVAVGIQSWRAHQAEERIQTLQEERAAIRAIHAQAQAQAIAEQRRIEQERHAAYEAEIEQARKDAEAAKSHANHLERVAGRLRDHIVYLATSSAAGPDPALASSSPPATSPAMVCADMYAGADREAVELAQAFDRAYAAGRVCERLHDTLRTQ
jgi:ABC-type transport system involved in cytochrome bd biosynthesis fused ATPase/permease subunit